MPKTGFTSIIEDKKAIKYFFVYGLDVADNTTQTPLKELYRNSYREFQYFHNILKSAVQENVTFFPVNIHDTEMPNVYRISNIFYRNDEKKGWANLIYSCYGINIDKKDENYIIMPNETVCKALELFNNVISEESFKNSTSNSFCKYYYDLIQSNENNLEVTEKRFLEFCFGRSVLNKQAVSKNIFEVIDTNLVSLYQFVEFISQITVLFPFGYFLGNNLLNLIKNKNSYQIYDQINSNMIIAKGLTPNIILAQEGIFRCLKAIHEKRILLINRTPFIPLEVFYKTQSPLYPPIPFVKVIEKTTDKFFEVNLCGYDIIRLGGKNTKDQKVESQKENGKHAAEKHNMSENVKFTVNFYIDFRFTTYLQDVIEQFPPAKKGRLIVENKKEKEKKKIDSPYYPDCLNPDIWEYEFDVDKYYSNEFVEWVRGFGDFASITSFNGHEDNDFQDAICNPYNSSFFHQLRFPLPPTNLEIFWLDYAIKKYPNFTKIFMDQDSIEVIQTSIDQYLNCQKEPFNPFDMEEFQPTVIDIKIESVQIVKDFLSYIQNEQVISYTRVENHIDVIERIFPYVIQYDNDDKSLKVMAYNLNEFRIIAFDPRKIEIKAGTTIEITELNDYEKLYLLVTKFENNLLSLNGLNINPTYFFTENTSKKNFEKWIKANREDYYKNKTDGINGSMERFLYYYTKSMSVLCGNHKNFINQAFSYYYDYFKDNHEKYDAEMKLQGVAPVTDEEILHKTNMLFLYYVALSQTAIAKIIEKKSNNTKYTEILNQQISYQAESMKERSVVLTMKEGVNLTNEILDKIFELFAPYNCICNSNNNKTKFTIIYEKFNYRKIHRLILALSNIWEVSSPEETKILIEKRIANML